MADLLQPDRLRAALASLMALRAKRANPCRRVDAMPRKRCTNEQMAFALRQAENGATVDSIRGVEVPAASHELCRRALSRRIEAGCTRRRQSPRRSATPGGSSRLRAKISGLAPPS